MLGFSVGAHTHGYMISGKFDNLSEGIGLHFSKIMTNKQHWHHRNKENTMNNMNRIILIELSHNKQQNSVSENEEIPIAVVRVFSMECPLAMSHTAADIPCPC